MRFPCETFQKHGGWTQAGLVLNDIALRAVDSARHLSACRKGLHQRAVSDQSDRQALNVKGLVRVDFDGRVVRVFR